MRKTTTQVFCDKCGKEFDDRDATRDVFVEIGVDIFKKSVDYHTHSRYDFCHNCQKEVSEFLKLPLR